MSFTPTIINRRSGKYYCPIAVNTNTNAVATLNTLIAVPFYVGIPTSFSDLAIASLGTVSSQARMGVYLDSNGVPGDLDFGSSATDISGGGTINFNFGGSRVYSGLIWLAYVAQSVTGIVVLYSYSNTNEYVNVLSPYSTGGAFGFSQTGITGALPSTWGSTLTETLATSCPIMYIKTS